MKGMKEYILLLSEYWDCYFKNKISTIPNSKKNEKNEKNENNEFGQFVFVRGLDTITHIFIYTILTANNLENAYTNAEKGIYYYIEFMNQMKEHKQMNLSLTTRDAVLYVYKKTIYSKDATPFVYSFSEKINTTQIYNDLSVFYNKLFKLYLESENNNNNNNNNNKCKKYIIELLQNQI
jgi:hypothetical protein